MWKLVDRNSSGLIQFCVRGLKITTERQKQKVAYKTRYHWFLDLHKSRRRARFPWIPREPLTTAEVHGQILELPEMSLEFIVPPNLAQSELKPYVDWRAETPNTEPLTAKRLFEQKYHFSVQDMREQGMNRNEIIKKMES